MLKPGAKLGLEGCLCQSLYYPVLTRAYQIVHMLRTELPVPKSIQENINSQHLRKELFEDGLFKDGHLQLL